MKKFAKCLFTTLLIIIFFGNNWIYGQNKNFTPGTIYLNDGTSKDGFLEKNIFAELGQQVLFRENLSSKVETFLPSEISGFTFKKTNTKYRSVRFKYYKIIKESDTYEKTNVATRFAKVMLSGEVDLLKVPIVRSEFNVEAIGSASHLYLIKKGDDFFQIDLLKTVLSRNLHLTVSNKYKGVLTYALRECEKISKIAERTEFTDKSIMNIISYYHDCVGSSDNLTKEEDLKTIVTSHSLKFGLLRLKDEAINDGKGFNFGYHLEFKTPAVSKDLGISFSLEYLSQNYYWESSSFTGDVKESNLRLNTSLDIYIIQREQFNIKLNPGFSFFYQLSRMPEIGSSNSRLPPMYNLELFVQLKRFGVFFQIGSRPAHSSRPDGLGNVGVNYQFK